MDIFADARSVPIKAVAERLFLRLYRKGQRWRIHCPDHHYDDNVDSHPSCELWEEANRFRCWSCDNRGNPIDLVMQVKGCNPLQAARWIMGR